MDKFLSVLVLPAPVAFVARIATLLTLVCMATTTALSLNTGSIKDTTGNAIQLSNSNNNFITHFKRAGLASTNGICCADSNAINFGLHDCLFCYYDLFMLP
jgi:hypothetical protein